MEWAERLDGAVDYIESNLNGRIDIPKAADRAYCSVYHFSRMFVSISGITPAEYGRRRRMTVAAADIKNGTGSIIDIALKFGYDSPSAFSRAFRLYHGVMPSGARESAVRLKAYPRISFRDTIRSNGIMDYRIIEKPGFSILGIAQKFGVADGEFSKKGRSFWSKFVLTEDYKKLCNLSGGRPGLVTGAPVMTAYLPNEDGSWDPVTNVFGIENPESMSDNSFELYTVPAATYAEFDCTMKTSTAVNKRIYGEWFPSTGYEHGNSADIALFYQIPWNRMVYVRWWVPVIKKSGVR